ncbi:polymer-forming cytoskeletal protein [Maribacter aestuarii]|uniref:polymer-forming cytoskeletal protein n=1 Tax=Maribacter aestuarii TaxID=1130723 RepID=UPI00248CA00F|nr:polymer-forming cytoskeletal protein [Maribacter aestuarii]
MRTFILYAGILFSSAISAQQAGENITISERQKDDLYAAGEQIRMEAPVFGDVVFAGGNITVKDTVYQDLLVAGGEILVQGYVADDIRAAGGKLTIDSEVGDDVIIAGGEVYITERAIIRGNLINFSGDIEMNGRVDGMIKSYSGELKINGSIGNGAQLYGENLIINGEINGTSKMVAEDITIEENAKFHNNVVYWTEDGEIDFKNSLVNTAANFDETLIDEREEFSWKGFGIAAIGFWIFYLFSAFLVILLLNWAFSNFFATAAAYINDNFLKSLGYGAIYLFGFPILILILVVILIGIPLGLFLAGFYLFSLLFGHLVGALLISHYLSARKDLKWNFWTTVLVALGIAAGIRILTFVPFLGGLIAIFIFAVGYGLILYTLLQKRIAMRIST